MTNWTKIVNANSLTHCRIAAKMSFLLFFPTRFAHAHYSSRMIDRFLNWGDHGKPKSGKIKGRCQPPLAANNQYLLGTYSAQTPQSPPYEPEANRTEKE